MKDYQSLKDNYNLNYHDAVGKYTIKMSHKRLCERCNRFDRNVEML